MPLACRLPCRRSLTSLAIHFALGWLSLPAFAMLETAIQLETSWATDSNPYRLPSGTATNNLLGRDKKDDQILSLDLRVAMIAPLLSDRTRLEINAGLGQRQYASFTQLDHLDKFIDSRLVWQGGNLFRGRLSYSQDDSLFRYQDSSFVDRDMTHIKRLSNEIAFRPTDEIELPLTLEQLTRRQDFVSNQPYDRNETSIQLAARHISPMGSQLNVGTKKTWSRYPHRTATQVAELDSHSTDNELFIDGDWAYSPLTRVGGRLGYIERKYKNIVERDFSRLATSVRVTYDYSLNTNFAFEAWTQPRESTIADTLYSQANGFQGGLNWQYSPLTKVRLQARQEKLEYVSANGIQLNSAVSTSRRFGARLDYQPARNWRLYLGGFSERIIRSGGLADIDQQVINAGIEYTYENLDGVSAKSRLEKRP